jgi:hypothetical protein
MTTNYAVGKPGVNWTYGGNPPKISLGQYFKDFLTPLKNNPGLGLGLIGTGAMNIGGLFDNDKVGGQLVGGLGGYAVGKHLLPQILGTVSPQAKVLATLGGGALGSLFDKLRQNKEDQYNAQMQQGGYY